MSALDEIRNDRERDEEKREAADLIDEADEESFPASDPPSWTPMTGVGPPASREAQQQTAATRTRSEHDALLAAMHRLEAALAAAAPGREHPWNRRVLDHLRGLEGVLAEHVASAEGPGGVFGEIDQTRPTLVRRIERLRREHADLLRQAQALQRLAAHYGEDERPDAADIRRRAAALLGALRHHQAAEADVIFESFCTDIGTCD
jgi:hemerythrin-like domain-containing protein